MEAGQRAHHDELRGWMTDVEARVALKTNHFEVQRLCDEDVLRYKRTPWGLLIDPQSVNSFRNQLKQKGKTS